MGLMVCCIEGEGWNVSKYRVNLGGIIKKDRIKMAAVVGLSTSRSEYFVRKECI